MFLKQTQYKPSANAPQSNKLNESAIDTSNTASAQPPAQTSGRRRSSAGVADAFSGLHSYKRSSQDASAAQRKASFAEQTPGKPGILGGMWNTFTKGT